ncbi:hypothetical protein FACS189472_12080 [Alphaproteobacteria bacterium]|nr:hypothetical protein FACS189472_12080 [Alphaproteobacteria bacterium]
MFVRFRFLAKIRTFKTTLSSIPSYRFIRPNPKTDTSMGLVQMKIHDTQKLSPDTCEENALEK